MILNSAVLVVLKCPRMQPCTRSIFLDRADGEIGLNREQPRSFTGESRPLTDAEVKLATSQSIDFRFYDT
jgi:hypothetical protein